MALPVHALTTCKGEQAHLSACKPDPALAASNMAFLGLFSTRVIYRTKKCGLEQRWRVVAIRIMVSLELLTILRNTDANKITSFSPLFFFAPTFNLLFSMLQDIVSVIFQIAFYNF